MKMIKHLLALMAPILLFAPVSAQTPWQSSQALESYMDGLIQTYMEENNIAGATVSLVKDGDAILLKGYGYADVENRLEVDPDSTLYRIGSISKMFVWTAIMQLAEQGKLDLETDVNSYLDNFKIPDTFAKPITLKHLMTHSAGFEDYVIGLFAKDSTRLKPLGEILAEEMPARVRPPGVESAYSNHGTGIAAYIVEQVSGMEFEDYVEQRIFEPLQMQHSTFRQPLPQNLKEHMSKGYSFEEGVFKEKDFEFVPLAPVGAASSTATDMINFMITHLQLGQFEEASIMDTETARQMQKPAFRHDEAVNPMRWGFIDMSQNNIEIIGHGGDTFWFHSNMALFPEQNIGLFLSFNSANGGGVKSEVLRDFVDHYFPEENLSSDTLSVPDEYLQRFAGDYRPNRYPHDRLTYVMALLNSNSVGVTDEGTLRTMEDGKANFWLPTDSLTFSNTKDSRSLVFDENKEGEIHRMYSSGLPIIAFEKIPFITSQKLHFSLFGGAGLCFLLTLIYWPSAYLIRRKYQPDYMAEYPLSTGIKSAAWLNALIMIAFFTGLALVVSGSGEAIVFGISQSLKMLLVLPLISVLLTLILLFNTFTIWRRGESGIWSRLWYTLITIFSATLLWQFWFWNLLGFNY